MIHKYVQPVTYYDEQGKEFHGELITYSDTVILLGGYRETVYIKFTPKNEMMFGKFLPGSYHSITTFVGEEVGIILTILKEYFPILLEQEGFPIEENDKPVDLTGLESFEDLLKDK